MTKAKLYSIWCDPGYYESTLNAPEPGWYQWDKGEIVASHTPYIIGELCYRLQPRGRYDLSHGQCSAPAYTVRELTETPDYLKITKITTVDQGRRLFNMI